MSIQHIFNLGMKRVINTPLPDRTKGLILNLGAGNQVISNTIPLDYPDWDADNEPIPYNDDCISQIHAYHFFEHCSKPHEVLYECQRVLVDGGHINIVVPYYSSQMQAQELDHKSQFCEETWRRLFDKTYYDKFKFNWRFEIQTNIIIGVVERNLALLTQLIKMPA